MDRETLQALHSFGEELEDRLFRLRPIVAGIPPRAMEVAPDSVHEAFRQLHSLKGAANLLNLRPIAELAHKLEDVLARVRAGELSFDDRLRSILLAGLDRIEELGEDLRKVRLVDVSRELAQIDALISGLKSSGG